MHKHKYRRGKRFAGLFLSAALVMTGIPVQAAEFTAPSAETDLFSSGVADAYTGGLVPVRRVLYHLFIRERVQNLRQIPHQQ